MCYVFMANAVNITNSLSPIQMAAADILKVNAYYNANPLMTIDTYYLAFDEHKATAPKEAKYGLYVKNKNNYYTKILHVETISCGDMLINIDNEDKVLVIGDNELASISPFSNSIDSLLLACSDVQLKNINSAERMYTLDFGDTDFSEYDKIDIYIDIKKSRFTKIVLYYSTSINLSGDYNAEEKQPRLEIEYKNYRNTIANPSILEKKNYVLETNGKLTAIGKLKNYSILDQRKKTRIKGYNKK